MNIRLFKKGDETQLAALHKAIVEDINDRNQSPEEITGWKSRIGPEGYLNNQDTVIRYIAEENGILLGFGELTADGERIHALYVDPTAQGTGVGTALIKTLFDKARTLGIKTLIVESSKSAKTFYEKYGFVLQKKNRQQFITGPEINSYVMKKDL